jgi:hypothetical protein
LREERGKERRKEEAKIRGYGPFICLSLKESNNSHYGTQENRSGLEA